MYMDDFILTINETRIECHLATKNVVICNEAKTKCVDILTFVNVLDTRVNMITNHRCEKMSFQKVFSNVYGCQQ